MRRRIVAAILAGLPVLGVGICPSAQTQSNQPAPSAQLAVQNSIPTQSSGQDSSMASTPTKKIWTNEDMGKSQGQPGISTFKAVDSKNGNTAAKPRPSHSHDPAWYRDQIAKLQTRIAHLDKQIAEIQSAIDGKPAGDAIQSTRPVGVKWDSWQHELADARQKREDLLENLSALQDEARHDGVNPVLLP